MARPAESNRAATRWTVRIIPLFIAAAFGVGTYAVAARLCVQYLYRVRRETGVAAALVALYFVFLALTVATYLRTFSAVQRDPGFVPIVYQRPARPPDDDDDDEAEKAWRGARCRPRRARDAEASPWVPPDASPDSPGLEAFYSKDVFVCEADGRPKWCSECRQWKPDRAHHSSELGRCVRKMDHLCPWVGGMVSETSFNFFFQFTLYTTCLCAVCIATGAHCVRLQDGGFGSIDGWAIAVIALASMFGFFTLSMALTSLRFIVTNTTSIDMLRKRQQIFLAVRVPRGRPGPRKFQTIVYPLRPQAPWEVVASSQARGDGQGQQQQQPDLQPRHHAARDVQATRTFAILRTEPRENPWDLGYWANWKSVMGNTVAEWLLPLWHSPCCNHESMESDYALGALLDALRRRYEVPSLEEGEARPPEAEASMEMGESSAGRV